MAAETSLTEREQHRQIVQWVATAVWRQQIDKNCIAASTILSEGLDALGVENRIVPVAAIIENPSIITRHILGKVAFDFMKNAFIQQGDIETAQAMSFSRPADTPEFWVDGGHAIVVCERAGLLVDASFDQFNTGIPFLLSDFDPEGSESGNYWRYGTDAVDAFYFPVADVIEVDEISSIAMRMMGAELAAVGRHVGFDQDLLNRVDHTLYPPMDVLNEIVAGLDRGDFGPLESYRSSRGTWLAKLGYPGPVPEAWILLDVDTAKVVA